MKLPFLHNKKKEGLTDELILSVDIGTEVLKMLLFRCSDMGVHVLKSAHIFQQRHAMKSGVIQSLETVIENCELGFNQITEDMDPQHYPSKGVMGIAGELIHGVSIVVNYDREDRAEKQVTEREYNNILDQVKSNILSSGKSDLAQKYSIPIDDIEILHITITGVEIGGMPVDSIVGFTGRQVRLNFYASFAPKTYIDALRKVAVSLNLELLGIVSQPFAMARVFSGSSDKTFSGIFIDIGGGTTDIALVKDGNVLDTQIFAFGGRALTKRLAKEMNLDYRHAEARKIKYSEAELDDKISAKVKKMLSRDLEIWAEGVKTALSLMEDADQYPPFIYLCGGGALLPDLRRSLIEYPWTQELNFTRFPKVLLVTPEKLDMIIDKNGALKNAMDVTPAGLARFAWDKLKYPGKHFES